MIIKILRVSAVFAVLIAASIAVFMFGAVDSTASRAEYWISVDASELQQIVDKQNAVSKSSLKGLSAASTIDGIAVLKLNDIQMEDLSRAMHEGFNKCGGYVAHESEGEAREWVERLRTVDTTTNLVTYSIDNQFFVLGMLAQVNELKNRQVILDLSAFPNRRYNQASGAQSAAWIKDKWTALAASRPDVLVEYYNHPTATSPQPSIILTIPGTEFPDEIVVLGAHQDSINSAGSTASAPGADDDASGIACLTESIRVMMAMKYRPKRTVQFMAYAAEEVGLRGSNAIATAYRAANKNVVGVMQLDMTNYKGSLGYDIVIFQDFTNAAQNQFVADLITEYQPGLTVGTSSCGYACSDHASWHNKSYPASLPFEATFNDDNSAIHTANDTIARSGNNADHAVKFTKLAVSFTGELAKGSAIGCAAFSTATGTRPHPCPES